MQLKSITLLLAGLLVRGSVAVAVAEPEPDNLVASHIENAEGGGSLIYYGNTGSRARRSEDPTHVENTADGGSLVYYGSFNERRQNDENLSKRTWPFDPAPKECKVETSPECDDKNGAANDVCDKLVTSLYGYSDISIPKSDRQICYQSENGDNKCCIKWTRNLDGLHKSDLAPIAQKMFKQCTENGISAKFNHVYLRSTCTSVCMSSGASCKHEAG